MTAANKRFITLSNFFFFKDAMAQNHPATKTLKAKGKNRTKSKMMVGNLIAATNWSMIQKVISATN